MPLSSKVGTLRLQLQHASAHEAISLWTTNKRTSNNETPRNKEGLTKEHMIAEIIAAGSEMLTPFRQDTHSLYLTDGLNDLGVQVAFKTIVGDHLAHLTSAALIALSRADIVIFSGGPRPTEDDLTREAVAAALGIGLH